MPSYHECETCGSLYELTSSKLNERDKDSISCDVCGATIKSWNGAVMWESRLLLRSDKRNDPTSEQQIMRYQLQQAGHRLNQGFDSLAEVEAHIEQHLQKGGLDWRAGYAFKAREDDAYFEVVNAKTGVVLTK